ncbi:IS30 family transposase, partial [Streptomyces fructofermentans]|uniref:IS30 family transposase n=1 Tax=Streptomyces fructofermentans TaxID=152141 RepID=UPI00379CA282
MDSAVRTTRKPQGNRPLVQERDAYFLLVDQGMSFVEAARAVGISTRTGERWRNGRGASGRIKAYPPINAAPAAEPGSLSRCLREAERVHIADRLLEKATIRAIAAELGRSPSTISREVRRNGTVLADGRWHYRPYTAQRRADARRPRPKTGKIAKTSELRDFIQSHLNLRWSPEQICHALRRRFAHRPDMHVSHETIYQALYTQGRTGLRRELPRTLRTGRARRLPRRLADRRRFRAVKNKVMISQRPREAADRTVPGHWEGDLILGRKKHSAIATLVERSTRYVMLVHLPDGYNSAAVRDALIATINPLPPNLKRSLTWDQGTEMAAHRGFSIATNVPVYFCDPGSPWQRGSNENT